MAPAPALHTALLHGVHSLKATRVVMQAGGKENDLLVVGAGVLGTLIGQQWLQKYPGSTVYGQTRSEARHAELQSLGIVPVTRSSFSADSGSGGQLLPFVVFCAPPSGNDDYAGNVRDAAKTWDGQGSFLFTSSSALYDVNDNGPCEEGGRCPSVPKGRAPRLDNLLNAEDAALEAGGNVVRLAGLYTEERGAHTFWLRKGTVESTPDHILNLISYEDAASLCVAILAAKTRQERFMGCDNHPVTRQELMDITVRSGRFEGTFNGFTGTSGPGGKRMVNDVTRQKLGWAPKYESFEAFLNALNAAAPAL